jgi:hypothetical protein
VIFRRVPDVYVSLAVQRLAIVTALIVVAETDRANSGCQQQLTTAARHSSIRFGNAVRFSAHNRLEEILVVRASYVRTSRLSHRQC